MVTANFVVKEMFVNAQRQSEKREQTPSKRDRGVAVAETS